MKAITDFAMKNEEMREKITEHQRELLYAKSIGESGV